jgi:two-component system response regulator PhoP
MRHHQQVVAKDRLMEQLYPDDDERDPNVIEVLVGRLRRKLEGRRVQADRYRAWPRLPVQ